MTQESRDFAAFADQHGHDVAWMTADEREQYQASLELDDTLRTVASQLAEIRKEHPGMSWADAARIRRERFGTVEP